MNEIFGISADEVLGLNKSKGGKPIAISSDNIYKDIPETIASQISSNLEILKDLIARLEVSGAVEEHEGFLTLPIKQLTQEGIVDNKKSGFLVIQNRVYGRIKNIVPIRINGEDQMMNVIVLEKGINHEDSRNR